MPRRCSAMSSLFTGTPRLTFTFTTASNGFISPEEETPARADRFLAVGGVERDDLGAGAQETQNVIQRRQERLSGRDVEVVAQLGVVEHVLEVVAREVDPQAGNRARQPVLEVVGAARPEWGGQAARAPLGGIRGVARLDVQRGPAARSLYMRRAAPRRGTPPVVCFPADS